MIRLSPRRTFELILYSYVVYTHPRHVLPSLPRYTYASATSCSLFSLHLPEPFICAPWRLCHFLFVSVFPIRISNLRTQFSLSTSSQPGVPSVRVGSLVTMAFHSWGRLSCPRPVFHSSRLKVEAWYMVALHRPRVASLGPPAPGCFR